MSRKRSGRPQRRPAVVNPPQNHHTTSLSIHQESHQHRVDINTTGIPSFTELAGYEEVLPGAADRIFNLAENQAGHRQGLERKVIGGDNIRAYLGMVVGAALQAGVIYGAIHLGDGGHDASAIALAGGGSVTGLSTIWSNWNRSKERAGRAD